MLSLLPLSYIDRKAVSGGSTANRWISCRMKCGKTSSLLCMLAATRYRSASSSRHHHAGAEVPCWVTQTWADVAVLQLSEALRKQGAHPKITSPCSASTHQLCKT